jgi:hypothetical protein
MTTPDQLLQGEGPSQPIVRRAEKQFLAEDPPMANIAGVGTGVKWTDHRPTGMPAVLIFVTQKLPEVMLDERDRIPSQLDDGTPTDVVSVGHPAALATAAAAGIRQADAIPDQFTISSLAGPQALVARMRPCPAGFSIGNVAVTAGSLGGVVYDFLPGATVDPPATGIGIPSTFYVLSNNHVLADCNQAPVGSPILQPGRGDQGQDPQDRIAILSRFVPIQFAPTVPLDQQQNVVDCAIGKCQAMDATREIYFNGAPRGWRRKADAVVGDLVRKTGRTTATTLGRIISADATIDVGYGSHGMARFKDQILTTGMSVGGDSGSLVTTLDNVAIGLLCAGSSQVTIVNYFENVRALLRVEIAELLL